MNDPIVVNKVFKNIDLNPKIFISKITDQKIKDKLKKITDNALKKGIFGAPTFLINKKFFGDKIDCIMQSKRQKNEGN